MTRTKTLAAVFTAAMLVLAGCSGAVSPGASNTDTGADDDSALNDGSGSGAGTVTLYVSDQPGAMDDFEHVNVTITSVAYHQADAEGDADANESEAEGESDADAEAEGEADAGANATDADDEVEEADEAEAEDDEAEDEDEAEAEDDEAEDEDEADEGDDGSEDGPWHQHEVNETTVDLTELKGANATAIAEHELPNGTYDTVHMEVTEINATLKTGESANVKLPSGKLQLNEEFTVGNNESVDFVYDATVVKAGNSGKYVLKPVVSESGTDVEIKEVAMAESEGDISARFVGPVERGQAATVQVKQDGQAVSGATVEINDAEYETAGDGTVTFDVPEDAEEVEIEIEYGEGEAELKRKFGVEVEADAGVGVEVEADGEEESDDGEESETEDVDDESEDSDEEAEAEADADADAEVTGDADTEDDETEDDETSTEGSTTVDADAESTVEASG